MLPTYETLLCFDETSTHARQTDRPIGLHALRCKYNCASQAPELRRPARVEWRFIVDFQVNQPTIRNFFYQRQTENSHSINLLFSNHENTALPRRRTLWIRSNDTTRVDSVVLCSFILTRSSGRDESRRLTGPALAWQRHRNSESSLKRLRIITFLVVSNKLFILYI